MLSSWGIPEDGSNLAKRERIDIKKVSVNRSISILPLRLLSVCLLIGWLSGESFSQSVAREREIAAAFAPTFYQALGDKPRSDYITNFDFDGDWRGDNNWEHTDDKNFPLRAYIYYSVSETQTHFLIHYAVFHPRDYKGGERKGPDS